MSRQRSRSRSWTKKGSGRLRLCLNPSVTITTFVAVDFHKKNCHSRKGAMQERRDLGREGFGTGGIQEVRVQDRRDAGIEEGFI